MSRELKFRVWNGSQFINTGKDCYVITPNDGKLNRVLFDEGGLLPYENAIIEQFTGLVDKNGKEIFEGDIVKIDDGECDFIGEVNYENYGYYAKGHYVNGGSDVLDFADVVDKGVIDGEIIGNIYENRDLLK